MRVLGDLEKYLRYLFMLFEIIKKILHIFYNNIGRNRTYIIELNFIAENPIKNTKLYPDNQKYLEKGS